MSIVAIMREHQIRIDRLQGFEHGLDGRAFIGKMPVLELLDDDIRALCAMEECCRASSRLSLALTRG